MPRWGRPPGARMGRHNGGVQWEGDVRVEELISDNEDVLGRELVRSGRYGRQQDYGARGPPRQLEYENFSDDGESVGDAGDYDIYEHGDSTVAYAVQLAMRDKEDQLVDSALDRIRRAQQLGKKNVRLSKRELAALERKRQQTGSSSTGGSTQRSRKGSTSSSRPSSRRNGHTVPYEQPYPLQTGAYPPFAPDGGWGRPSSSSSANRPRTPTMQSLRPQQSISPLRPPYPMFPGTPPHSRPQSMQQPMYARPLPDDPQWAPPYYNSMPMQMSPYPPEQPPYPSQLPEDLRVGPQSRYSYSAGMPPQVPHRRSISGRKSSGSSHAPTSPPKSKESSSEEETESSSDDSDAQTAPVSERDAPAPAVAATKPPAQAQAQASPGLQRRRAPAGNRGLQRKSR